MTTISDDIRSTIRSMVYLASPDNTNKPLQINIQQCQLLANKASESLAELEEFLLNQCCRDWGEPKIPDWTPIARELHRVLEHAESLIQDCCCGHQWLENSIHQGNLKETFAKTLQDIEWHMSLLWSILVTEGDVVERLVDCQGKLKFSSYFGLQAAAKHDLESLRDLLRGSHVCDGEVCKSDCLAIKLLEKLDAEGKNLVDRKNPLESNSPLFLWVQPKHLREGSNGRAELGRGSFASVKETKWLGQTFAWKIFTSGKAFKMTFMQEMAVMAGLNHPHVVRVACCSEDAHDIGIVMELMYKSLHDLLKDFQRREHPFAPDSPTPFSIIQSVDLMLQIAEGVRFIHSKGLAHRDLKSPNILVQFANQQTSKGTITSSANSFMAKIADFGLTKMKNDSTAYGNQTLNVGTRKWMAPEVPMSRDIEGIDKPSPSSRFHPKKLDVYAFGILCCEILTGEEPYQDASPSYIDVKAGVRPKLPDGTPQRLATLIKLCWDGNPRRRPEFPAICTELRFIKALLLRGDNSVLQQIKIGVGCGFSGETPVIGCDFTGIRVQGPWGGLGGGAFFDGLVTSIRQIKLKYDTVLMRIWNIEMEYDLNGTSFFIGHGDGNPNRWVRNTVTIEIDDPIEHIIQLQGAFSTTPNGGNPITSITSLTIYTNKKMHGPFGGIPEGATTFQSEFGRILGFHGRCGLELDAIGCFSILAQD